jgi:hypothetical protein
MRRLTQEGGVLGIGPAAEKTEDIGPGRVDQSQDGSRKSGPVNNSVGLVSEDSEETEGDDEGTDEVTLGMLVLNIANSGGGKEEKTNENKDDVESVGSILLNTGESSEGVDNSDEDDPSVPEGERSVDEQLVGPSGSRVVLLKVIENEGDRGSGQQEDEESKEKVTMFPEREPDSIQQGGNDKVPSNTVDNSLSGGLEPLVDDEATEEKVDHGPDIENPGSRGDVSLVLGDDVAIGTGTDNRVHGGGEEEEVHQDIGNLESDWHSQFNFGFVELATLTPIKHYPATYACKWFKEYMAISCNADVHALNRRVTLDLAHDQVTRPCASPCK